MEHFFSFYYIKTFVLQIIFSIIRIQAFTNIEVKLIDHKSLSDCYMVTSGFSILMRKNSGFSLFLNQMYFSYKKNLKLLSSPRNKIKLVEYKIVKKNKLRIKLRLKQ